MERSPSRWGFGNLECVKFYFLSNQEAPRKHPFFSMRDQFVLLAKEAALQSHTIGNHLVLPLLARSHSSNVSEPQ